MAELAAVVVGAGFSGLCAGIQLRSAGIEDFVILEQANGIGGTWRDNTYPGAACDIPSHLYSFSFEPNPRWSRAYGGQAEILAYLEHCTDKYGLRPHLRLGARVVRAVYSEVRGTWTVETQGGARYVARALLLGNGALHVPSIPKLPGLSTFAGAMFHSARWDHSRDLTGRRVAVIGTGASAVQFVPEIAPRVSKLHVFQRTPTWLMPKTDRPMTERERWILEHVPGAHWLRRTGIYWGLESLVLTLLFGRASRLAERLARAYLERTVPDPELRRRLTPDHRFGCKRLLLSNDYYPALLRPNVELVTDAIAAVEPSGIRTADGRLHEVDTIILGTGFRFADYMTSIKVIGRDGRELNEVWRSGVRNYLGINVSGFPNLFLLMGPNTGIAHNSIVFMIEAQVRYAMSAILAMRRDRLATIDVRPEIEQAFHAELRDKLATTTWTSGCSSYYRAPSGDVLVWPSFSLDYWRRTRQARMSDYDTRALAHVQDDELPESVPQVRVAI
jgi:cation diffusion facilitator CzcD-associated flavoprotein CzcO